MNENHTSGPWSYRRDIQGVWYLIEARQKTVAIVDYLGEEKLPRQEATARLISAAPDLLDALRDVAQTLAWMQNGKCRGFSKGLLSTDEALEKAKFVIAKATGETK